MKLKTTHNLIISLILTLGYLTPVIAVTDAELETLEKQIEQQEAKEVRQAKEEAKRKVEKKRKTEAEAEKKRFVELEMQRQEEQRRLEEERKALEESRLAELERKRHEEKRKEKYNLFIAEAEQAINDKDKELAISKYNEVLIFYPGDAIAQSGIKEAEKLMDKICYSFVGTWERKEIIGSGVVRIKEDGTFFYGILDDRPYSWRCIPEKKQIIENSKVNAVYTINDNSDCLLPDYSKNCFLRYESP
jgi:hypothetical protein